MKNIFEKPLEGFGDYDLEPSNLEPKYAEGGDDAGGWGYCPHCDTRIAAPSWERRYLRAARRGWRK